MDIISWAVGLVAGLALPSLTRAVIIGAATSVVIRIYQYAFTEPQQWGHTMPEDLFGATAMIAVTALLAWIGSIIRTRRTRRTQAEVAS